MARALWNNMVHFSSVICVSVFAPHIVITEFNALLVGTSGQQNIYTGFRSWYWFEVSLQGTISFSSFNINNAHFPDVSVIFADYFVSSRLSLDQPFFQDCCQQQLHLPRPSANDRSLYSRAQVPLYHLICRTMEKRQLAAICACEPLLQHWGSDFSCTNMAPSDSVPTSGDFLNNNK